MSSEKKGITHATVQLRVDPRDAVPKDANARIAWLEAHGAMPSNATVAARATLREWAAVGAKIDAQGNVDLNGEYIHTPDGGSTSRYWFIHRALDAHIMEQVAASGVVPAEVDAGPALANVVEQLAAVAAEVDAAAAKRAAVVEGWLALSDADFDATDDAAVSVITGPYRWENGLPDDLVKNLKLRIDASDKRRRAAREAERIAEEAVDGAERLAWITQHGSERLRLAAAVGLTDAVDRSYQEERLAHEMGAGWEFDSRASKEIREPTMEGLRALEAARAATDGQEVQLVWAPPDHSTDCQELPTDECICDPEPEWHEALETTFLGRTVRKDV